MKIDKSTVNKMIELHQSIVDTAKLTIDKAIELGEMLKEVKAELKHGEFTSWINDNLPFTDRTARNYMNVAENRKLIETESVSVLNDAYRKIRIKENENNRNKLLPQRKYSLTELPTEAERVLLYNKNYEFCIAIAPYQGNPFLQTADFRCDELLFNNIIEIKDKDGAINKILDLYNSEEIECIGTGTWGNTVNNPTKSFIRGAINGWHSIGIEHGIPPELFKTDISIIYSDLRTDEQKLKQKLDSIEQKLDEAYKKRDEAYKIIEELEKEHYLLCEEEILDLLNRK